MSDPQQPPPTTDSGSAEEKKQKERSPSYPAIGLEKAIQLAATFWEHDKRNSAFIARAATNLGYGAKSSYGLLAIAAMKKYGLLDEEGSGPMRKVKLTETAISLVNPSNPNRASLIKEAALRPSIHAYLWETFVKEGASDGTIRDNLIFDRKFTGDAADALIAQFKDTVAFAKLRESDTSEAQSELQNQPPTLTSTTTADAFIQPPKRYAPPAGMVHAFSAEVNANELPIPLDGGLVARVPFPMSEDTFELLVGTLQLWKKKLTKPEPPPSTAPD